MGTCLICGEPASIGVLCTGHGVAIASAGLTSEQILSRVDKPTASLVDAWGFPHPVTTGTVIGRDPAGVFAVMHASVSSTHAELKQDADGWELVDLKSRNGTTVDGKPGPRARLTPGVAIGFGEIRFYFWTPALPVPERPTGRGRTAPTRRDSIVFAAQVMTRDGRTVELSQRTDGGFARSAENVVELARMEFGLIQLLAERRRIAPDPEHSYVAWHEIAEALAFDSVEADSENVRDLVRRVRRKLSTLACGELIESKHGVGYRLSGALR
ncbi:MAG TPA: FHA domain-containing protein [Kofleriaceae bacterium]|nr:FHA domain-containing protein [Kofleriaceae bacterium]